MKIYKKKFMLSCSSAIILLFCAWAFLLFNNIIPCSSLNFIHISDTHTGDYDKSSYYDISQSKALLADAVDNINLLNKKNKVDFVLFSGDLVNHSNRKNFKNFHSIAKNLKPQYFIAFGNHDFYRKKKEEVLDINKKLKPDFTYNDTYYALTPKKDYRLIILDSTIKNNDTAQGFLDKIQLDFLKNELENNKDKIILLCMHHPVIEPYLSKGHELINSSEVIELLEKFNNPIIVFSGHYHSAKITKREKQNILYVSTPSLVTYPMAYRLVKIVNHKDKIKVKLDFISTKLDNIKDKNKLNHKNYLILEGSEKDKNYNEQIQR